MSDQQDVPDIPVVETLVNVSDDSKTITVSESLDASPEAGGLVKLMRVTKWKRGTKTRAGHTKWSARTKVYYTTAAKVSVEQFAEMLGNGAVSHDQTAKPHDYVVKVFTPRSEQTQTELTELQNKN